MVQYSFVNPQFQMPEPVRKSLDDGRQHVFLAVNDGGLCGYWRSRFISQALEFVYADKCACIDSRIAMYDRGLLNAADSCRCSRFCKEHELQWMRYARQVTGGRLKLIYDIDDILVYDDIPEYNMFRNLFPGIENILRDAMLEADVITVTSEYLRDYYVNKLQIPPERFVLIPNYPPRWLFDNYHPELVHARCRRHKKHQMRIGIAASATHFSADTETGDDCSVIADWIIRNRKKYKFVFKGGFSSYFEPYADDFEIHPGSNLLAYPKDKLALDVDLMIQPLQDNLFNRCKSLIKFYESWGDGTPCFVSGVANYLEAAPECCFRDSAELDGLIADLFSSEKTYMSVAENNYKRLNSLWLDKNLDKWIEVMM